MVALFLRFSGASLGVRQRVGDAHVTRLVCTAHLALGDRI
jgi:hypothetical protein